MIVTLQPFLIHFISFLSKNHNKNNLLSEHNGDYKTIRIRKIGITVPKRERDGKLGVILLKKDCFSLSI